MKKTAKQTKRGREKSRVGGVTGERRKESAPGIAKQFAAEGRGRVVVNYASSKEGLRTKVVDEIMETRRKRAVGSRCKGKRCKRWSEVEALFAAAEEGEKLSAKIDILVNNAGAFTNSCPLEDTTEQQFHRMFRQPTFSGMPSG